MASEKNTEAKLDFVAIIEALEVEKGVKKELIINALEEAMIKGFKKQIGGDDAEVIVTIDPTTGALSGYHLKNVVEEVEDDFLEVSKEDAEEEVKEGKGEIKEDKIYYPISAADLKKSIVLSVKSVVKQKIAEEEQLVLLDRFKDKINTMIFGTVEKVEDRGAVSVNIGNKTTVYLPRNQMIGDERFNQGDPIRLYVSGIEKGTKGGSRIAVSRANEGFLKCIFTEEIREIYDGTITIQSIAREAGERSKIAVWTNNPEVDPAGACIGPNGSRIQKIVSQLGNGNAKEKIDIIGYSDNIGLYVMEALKPAHVAGVIVDEENKSAIAIVKDDSLSLAIGRRGVNVRLAVRLTGVKIDIKTETAALEEGLTYQTIEELQAYELEKKALALAEARKAQIEAINARNSSEVLPGLPEGYVAPQARVYDDEINDVDEELNNQIENEDDTYVAPTVVEETPVAETKEEVKEEAVATKEEVIEVKAVKTTTTISDLEKNLEDASRKKNSSNTRKSFSRKKKEEEEEEVVTTTIANDPSKYMSIYSEEELAEIAKEEAEYDDNDIDEDVDYDDYDDYYDEDVR